MFTDVKPTDGQTKGRTLTAQNPNDAMVTGLPAAHEDCSVHRWQQLPQRAI